MGTISGASGAVVGSELDEPMWVHTGMPVSCSAAKSGSQWRFGSWSDGSPSGAVSSGKVLAFAPFAAQRSTSVAASRPSHNGTMTSGMKRPGEVPHHSSIIQSL